jgi:hypothetical protein
MGIVGSLCIGSLSSCQRDVATSAQHGETPTFEIREVRCNLNASDIAWSYHCQGTVLTRDARLQSAKLVLWYRDVTKQPGENTKVAERSVSYVVMSEGVATLPSYAYYSKKKSYGGGITTGDFDKDPGAPEPVWEILGYSTLEPLKVEVQK